MLISHFCKDNELIIAGTRAVAFIVMDISEMATLAPHGVILMKTGRVFGAVSLNFANKFPCPNSTIAEPAASQQRRSQRLPWHGAQAKLRVLDFGSVWKCHRLLCRDTKNSTSYSKSFHMQQLRSECACFVGTEQNCCVVIVLAS